MFRQVFKLTKSFSDVAGPRRVAESIRNKIDKFKVHIPLLQTICNPGIRDRHWEQVSWKLKFFVLCSSNSSIQHSPIIN